MEQRTQVVESSYDVRDYRICAEKQFPDSYELPLRVNIKNQGSKPTCVAHALASLVEYHNLVETKILSKPQLFFHELHREVF